MSPCAADVAGAPAEEAAGIPRWSGPGVGCIACAPEDEEGVSLCDGGGGERGFACTACLADAIEPRGSGGGGDLDGERTHGALGRRGDRDRSARPLVACINLVGGGLDGGVGRLGESFDGTSATRRAGALGLDHVAGGRARVADLDPPCGGLLGGGPRRTGSRLGRTPGGGAACGRTAAAGSIPKGLASPGPSGNPEGLAGGDREDDGRKDVVAVGFGRST